MNNVTLTSIDLAKEVFEIRSENHQGRLVRRERVRRSSLAERLHQLPKGSTVVMEACGSAHYWGHTVRDMGLKPLLISPQFVTPFRKSQKNDQNDAEAICEAARRPGMRFVSLKSNEQLDIQITHRFRERLIKERTAQINQIRGFLSERGIVFPKSANKFFSHLREMLCTLDQATLFGRIIHQSYQHLENVEAQLTQCTKELHQIAKQAESARTLSALRGIGPLAATACIALVANPADYKNGRNFAASLGLTPRQFSSGGKQKLGAITKCGDCYTRKLLVHGARAVVYAAVRLKKTDPLSLWIRSLHERHGTNHASVALANKTARHIWATLAGKSPEEMPPLAQAA